MRGGAEINWTPTDAVNVKLGQGHGKELQSREPDAATCWALGVWGKASLKDCQRGIHSSRRGGEWHVCDPREHITVWELDESKLAM